MAATRHARDHAIAGAGAPPAPGNRYSRFRQISSLENDFFVERDLQRSNSGPNGWTVVQGIGRQDLAMTTSIGPIYDRSMEHLGNSHAMVIQVRRRLLSIVNAYSESGATPPGVDDPSLYRLRSGSVLLDQNVEDWFEARELRTAFLQNADLDYSLSGGSLCG